MYKLQPIQGSITTISRKSTAPNLNSIDTVETVECRLEEEEEGWGGGFVRRWFEEGRANLEEEVDAVIGSGNLKE